MYGDSTHSSSIDNAFYKNRLKELSSESQDFYDKYVSDILKIHQAGLKTDPSKCSNFRYEKGVGISFIDIDKKTKTSDNSTVFRRSAAMFINSPKYSKDNYKQDASVNQDAATIFKKLDQAFKNNGIKIPTNRIVAENYPGVAKEMGIKVRRITIDNENKYAGKKFRIASDNISKALDNVSKKNSTKQNTVILLNRNNNKSNNGW